MLCTHECLWVSILWLSPKLNVRVLEMIYNFLGENITIIIIQNYGTKIMEAKNFDSQKVQTDLLENFVKNNRRISQKSCTQEIAPVWILWHLADKLDLSLTGKCLRMIRLENLRVKKYHNTSVHNRIETQIIYYAYNLW